MIRLSKTKLFSTNWTVFQLELLQKKKKDVSNTVRKNVSDLTLKISDCILAYVPPVTDANIQESDIMDLVGFSIVNAISPKFESNRNWKFRARAPPQSGLFLQNNSTLSMKTKSKSLGGNFASEIVSSPTRVKKACMQ